MSEKKSSEKLSEQHNINPNPTQGSDKERVDQASVVITTTEAQIDSILSPPLSTKNSRELLRVRSSAAPLIPLIVELIVTRPSLVPVGTTADDVVASLNTLSSLKGLATRLNGFQKHVEDSVRALESQLWRDVLDIYAVASRRNSDPQVNDVVQRMKEAMATGPRYPRVLRTPLDKPKHVVIPAPRPVVTFVPDGETTGAGSQTQAQASSTPPQQATAAAAAPVPVPASAGSGAAASTAPAAVTPAAPSQAGAPATATSGGGGTAAAGLNGSSALVSSANGATPASGA